MPAAGLPLWLSLSDPPQLCPGPACPFLMVLLSLQAGASLISAGSSWHQPGQPLTPQARQLLLEQNKHPKTL